jgi:hypothetical protein
MDNRLLNINGETQEQLALALQIAFTQTSSKWMAMSSTVTQEYGLILSWWYDKSKTDMIPFISPLTFELATPIVWAWLQSVKTEDFKLGAWEEDIDQDGFNGPGWRVYVGEWGHVGNVTSAICAIKPVFLWYGK